jgi:hypothetical protein
MQALVPWIRPHQELAAKVALGACVLVGTLLFPVSSSQAQGYVEQPYYYQQYYQPAPPPPPVVVVPAPAPYPRYWTHRERRWARRHWMRHHAPRHWHRDHHHHHRHHHH